MLEPEAEITPVTELLRCAAATAYEAADQLTGRQRDLAFSVVHLIEMARKSLAQSLVHTEASL